MYRDNEDKTWGENDAHILDYFPELLPFLPDAWLPYKLWVL